MNVFGFPLEAALEAAPENENEEEEEEDMCLDDYACLEDYDEDDEDYDEDDENYLAGMIVCVYLHGIIYNDQIIKLLTKCILVQSASNMKDYGFKPSREMINFIMSNGDGSKGRIDEIKRQIRDMENAKFADTFSKEQFTCTTQEACESFFELYRECEKYSESEIKDEFYKFYEKLIDANVIDTHEIKETIENWVDEIYVVIEYIRNKRLGLSGGMFGGSKQSKKNKNKNKIKFAKKIYKIKSTKKTPSNHVIGISPDRKLEKRNKKNGDAQAQKLYQEMQQGQQPPQETPQETPDEIFNRYLKGKQEDLLTEFAKNNEKYYSEDPNSKTPKRHLTYDGAAGLPYWSFGGRQAGEDSDNYRGLMIRSCEGSHLDFFLKNNGFNPTSEEDFILRKETTIFLRKETIYNFLAILGNTCFYISGVTGYVKDDPMHDELDKKEIYDELLEEMSRNYDMDPLTPVEEGELPLPYKTDMLRVSGFINYVRFLATRYYQTQNGIAWTPYLQFINDSTTMKAYVYVFSCSKIEESMCSFTGKDLKRLLTGPTGETTPGGGSKTRRKKPRNKHSQKSRKRSNSLIRKVKRKPRK